MGWGWGWVGVGMRLEGSTVSSGGAGINSNCGVSDGLRLGGAQGLGQGTRWLKWHMQEQADRD